MLITHPRYFQPEVLTALFRASKAIGEHEAVSKLSQESVETVDHTQIFTFAVQYQDFRTQRHAPDYVTLKLGNKDAEYAYREIDFFNRIALPMRSRLKDPSLAFPICYDAYQDDISGQFHIILEGTNREYQVAKNHVPPTARHREHLIDTLSTLHAYWWEHPLLENISAFPTEETLNERSTQLQAKLDELTKAVGKYLDDKYLSLLGKIAEGVPEKQHERLIAGQGLTVVHGNLIPENLLYSTRETMILNWQHWSVAFGALDLATMIPLYWSQDLRGFQEKPLLQRYYNNLIKNKVTTYSWDDFMYDYKASLTNIVANDLLKWTPDAHTRGHWRKMSAAIDNFLTMDGPPIYN